MCGDHLFHENQGEKIWATYVLCVEEGWNKYSPVKDYLLRIFLWIYWEIFSQINNHHRASDGKTFSFVFKKNSFNEF